MISIKVLNEFNWDRAADNQHKNPQDDVQIEPSRKEYAGLLEDYLDSADCPTDDFDIDTHELAIAWSKSNRNAKPLEDYFKKLHKEFFHKYNNNKQLENKSELFSDNLGSMTFVEVQKEFSPDKLCEWVFDNVKGKTDTITNTWKTLETFVEELYDDQEN